MIAQTFNSIARAAPPLSSGAEYTWRPLHYLNLYRITLAGLLTVLFVTGSGPNLLGEYYPRLFFVTSITYLALALANSFVIRWRRPAFDIQVATQITLDIFAIVLLMHASGGVTSGLGMLLVVAIAGGGILTAGRTAIMFAAIAALVLLIEQVYAHLNGLFDTTAYTQASIVGATCFATAILAHVLAKRIRDSEALAAQRGIDLANMEQLTQYVIQRMQTGVIIVDSGERIRLINESARHLLGLRAIQRVNYLSQASSPLAERYHAWYRGEEPAGAPLRNDTAAAEVTPRFAQLGTDAKGGALIFLEDTTAMAQQAQQLKLASLGRLTASIAHEIRNPLGAISHAGQLLEESPGMNADDTRLTHIIREQSKRVNEIIENVLQLSRRDRSRPQDFALKPWLERFVDEFCRSHHLDPSQIAINLEPEEITVRIDPSQLFQVVWNLCDNGLHYSATEQGLGELELRGGIAGDSNTPYLEVVDFGPGIDEAKTPQLFEPFFTTKPGGTGLGLYIASELCACNQARLSYHRSQQGGSCFRITFADPRRRQVT